MQDYMLFKSPISNICTFVRNKNLKNQIDQRTQSTIHDGWMGQFYRRASLHILCSNPTKPIEEGFGFADMDVFTADEEV